MPMTIPTVTVTVAGRSYLYREVPQKEVPSDVCFDVPSSNQGQMQEVAYGRSAGEHSEAVAGATWRRYRDRGENTANYYRLAHAVNKGELPCSIIERGNGFAGVGDLVVELVSGEMWRVVSIDSRVQPGDWMRGVPRHVHATVASATAGDVDDAAEAICSVRFDR